MRRNRQNSNQIQVEIYFSLFVISAATFLFEIILTRLFSITHFYHFAFMIISLALLGTGASGSFLTFFRPFQPIMVHRWFSLLCAACGLSILGSYLLFNHVPFDSYSIIIEPIQVLRFLVQLVALSTPFFFIGLAINGLIGSYPGSTHRIYAVNLSGSALGCILAPMLLPALSGVGSTLLCCTLASSCALLLILVSPDVRRKLQVNQSFTPLIIVVISLIMIFLTLPEVVTRARKGEGNEIFDLYVSPYKSISYALQYPDAFTSATYWNSFSRVDVVKSKSIRSIPGLSYLYPGLVNVEAGLFVDGDNLSPVLPVETEAIVFRYLPQYLAFELLPSASTLVLEPRGGLDLLVAHAGGSRSITAVEGNSLLVRAASEAYTIQDTSLFIESPRSFLSRTNEDYDVIIYSLPNNYYPVNSGSYSLREDYFYTVESIKDALSRLNPNGILVINGWLQLPPSEFLRLFILAVEALEDSDLDPYQQIAAFRGYNLGTLLVSKTPFTAENIKKIRDFTEGRAFDLIFLAGMQPGENNRFNILPEDKYYSTFHDYLDAADRKAWLRDYPYDINPPTDNQPFFGQFFKWSQLPQILRSIGTTWQPFGGAGYLVILFIFVLVLLVSMGMIILPVLIRRIKNQQKECERTEKKSIKKYAPIYFMAIGIGFMAIEIPTIQKFILLLGQPTYSFSAVLFTLLLASGIGSLFSNHIDKRWLIFLGFWACTSIFWLPSAMQLAVGLPLILRFAVVPACLSLPGFLMGIAFPKGIHIVEKYNRQMIPWLWAINGASSVSASVLCALLAISFGFTPLLLGGGICYLSAYFLLGKLHD